MTDPAGPSRHDSTLSGIGTFLSVRRQPTIILLHGWRHNSHKEFRNSGTSIKEPRRNILCIQTQPLAPARGSACAFDGAGPRGHPVRERLRTFETFGQLIFSRPLMNSDSTVWAWAAAILWRSRYPQNSLDYARRRKTACWRNGRSGTARSPFDPPVRRLRRSGR